MSAKRPLSMSAAHGGQREFAPILARAAVSIGIAAIFMETHQDPENAPSDGPNMIPLKEIKNVIEILMEFDHLAKRRPLEV